MLQFFVPLLLFVWAKRYFSGMLVKSLISEHNEAHCQLLENVQGKRKIQTKTERRCQILRMSNDRGGGTGLSFVSFDSSVTCGSLGIDSKQTERCTGERMKQ